MDYGGRLMSEPEAYQYPHYATIVFDIKINKMLPDGSLDSSFVSEKELNKFGISKTAVFGVHGYDKVDCIKKVKQVLEALKYE